MTVSKYKVRDTYSSQGQENSLTTLGEFPVCAIELGRITQGEPFPSFKKARRRPTLVLAKAGKNFPASEEETSNQVLAPEVEAYTSH